jgi:hypothetical protein
MKIRSSLPPEERRRAIARELEVDEGTVRNDRMYLVTPEHDRQVKKE